MGEQGKYAIDLRQAGLTKAKPDNGDEERRSCKQGIRQRHEQHWLWKFTSTRVAICPA